MGKLDSLKITECPFAFASFAAKHNALCDLMAGMVGENGISVVMAEKNAIIRANIAAGPAGPSGNVAGNTVNVVGSTGLLQNVYAGDPLANAYPTHLQVGSGLTRAIMESNELSVSTNTLSQFSLLTYDTIKLYNSPKRLLIDAFYLAHDMDIREIDVCDGGVAKKMLVIASAPY